MQIPDDRFARIAADGNQPLLRAFAHKPCDSAVHIDIIEIRTARLRHAGTGRIHEFEQCLVTQHHRIIGKLRHGTIMLSVLRNGDRVQQSSHSSTVSTSGSVLTPLGAFTCADTSSTTICSFTCRNDEAHECWPTGVPCFEMTLPTRQGRRYNVPHPVSSRPRYRQRLGRQATDDTSSNRRHTPTPSPSTVLVQRRYERRNCRIVRSKSSITLLPADPIRLIVYH